VAVIFTFPLQNFPSLEIACAAISSVVTQNSSSQRYCSTSPLGRVIGKVLRNRNVVSSLLVCLLGVIAVLTMERLDKVVSLMGSLLGCPLAFCAPPLIHNQLDTSLSRRRVWQNKTVSYLGFGAMILASVTTILTW
jgi:proton-coupled amino acid transporter